MKKFVAIAAALCMAVSLAACGSAPSSSAPAANTDSSDTTVSTPASETSELEGAVTTGGSTSVEKVILAMQESFMNANPGVDVTYDPTGSGAGITGASEGTLDIGLSSRALKEDETGLVGTTFALDGIAIIVNNENTVTDLSLEQIAQIYTGAVTDWSELGSDAGAIAVIGRESGSGTRDGFESITGTEDQCVLAQELSSTGAVIEAVRTTPGAIGYASLSAVQDQEGITVLTVGGVAPSEATVLDGSYAIQRPFVFATRTDEALSEAAQAFFDFATSTAANDLIANAGAVPVAQ